MWSYATVTESGNVYTTGTLYLHITSRVLQKENFHWNLNFAISLMADSLNFNSANYYILENLLMMAYITKSQE